MSDEARSVVAEAQAHYEAGRFAEAGPAFERAYEITEHHSMIYNAYVAYRDAGQPRDALRTMRLYLEVSPADDPERPLLSARLHALEAQVAALDGAAAPTDGASSHASAGSRQESSGTSPDGRGGPDIVVPAILLGAGGAVVASGLVLGGVTAAQHDRFTVDCGTGACPALSPEADEGRTLALVADILWTVGAAAAAAGLVWLIIAIATAPDGSPENAAFECGPSGCGGHF